MCVYIPFLHIRYQYTQINLIYSPFSLVGCDWTGPRLPCSHTCNAPYYSRFVAELVPITSDRNEVLAWDLDQFAALAEATKEFQSLKMIGKCIVYTKEITNVRTKRYLPFHSVSIVGLT